MSLSLDQQLQIALQNRQTAKDKKDNRGFNFWTTQIEVISEKIKTK